MNRNGLMATFALVFLAASQVFAQGPATQTRPQAPAAQTSTTAPASKLAVIYSEAFQDPKTGIARFVALANKLNGEFDARQKKINDMAQKIKQLQDEISRLQGTPSVPANIQAKLDQLDQMKKDYQREGEDAQAQYQKRRVELFTPLQEDVGKALDAYAKAHGISLIIDGSQVPILYAAESVDITKAFIIEYNSKNPATASVTTPK